MVVTTFPYGRYFGLKLGRPNCHPQPWLTEFAYVPFKIMGDGNKNTPYLLRKRFNEKAKLFCRYLQVNLRSLCVFYTQIMVITYPTTRGREINVATRSRLDFLMTPITRTFAKRILFFCSTGGRKLLAPLYFVSWPRHLLCANSSIPTLTAE